MNVLTGVAGAPGVALGPAFVYRPSEPSRTAAAPGAQAPASELERLEAALDAARRANAALEARVAKAAGAAEAAICAAHGQMLTDPVFWDEVRGEVKAGRAAAAAVEAVVARYAQLFAALEEPVLRERGSDLADVGRQVVRQLAGGEADGPAWPMTPAVLLAPDLAPSETAALDPALVLALVTEAGGPTSHTAILARGLGIPAVLGVPGLLAAAQAGELVGVDGDAGRVYLAPEEAVAAKLRARLAAPAHHGEELADADQPALTADGRRVEVAANAGSLAEVRLAAARGADGVGLLRTEFLYLGRQQAPDEEEQYALYRDVLEQLPGRRVVIRTLDVGGDKRLPYLALDPEANPFLGLRGIRVCLARPDLFQTQLRAIVRAAVHGRAAVMFPMVTSADEVRAAKAELAAARAEVLARGQAAGELEVGVMVEVPAAALAAASLAAEVDFFSIGSNDLVQYTLAVDRLNERVAGRYQPFHPAVWRLIALAIAGAHQAGKWVGLCGELAADPRAVPLLVGLGLDELSVAPASLVQIKQAVRQVEAGAAAALAVQLERCTSSAEILALSQRGDA
jgi:phosphotransferase system enzyme I (PtsI)